MVDIIIYAYSQVHRFYGLERKGVGMISGSYSTCLSVDPVQNEDEKTLQYPIEILSAMDTGDAFTDQ